MSYKVAFASTDGKVVNQHFGKAEKFHIVEINQEDKSWKFIESRNNVPSCSGFQHTEEALLNAVNVIKDCRAVFIAKIGPGASAKIQSAGISLIEAPYFIEDIIEKLLNSRVKLF